MSLQLLKADTLRVIAENVSGKQLSARQLEVFHDVAVKEIQVVHDVEMKIIQVDHEYRTKKLNASTALSMKQMEVMPVVFGFLILAVVLITMTGRSDIFSMCVLILISLVFGSLLLLNSEKALQLQVDDIEPDNECAGEDSAMTDGEAQNEVKTKERHHLGTLELFFCVLFTALFFGMTAGFDAYLGMATALSVFSLGHCCTDIWCYIWKLEQDNRHSVDTTNWYVAAAIFIDVAWGLYAMKAIVGVTTIFIFGTILIAMFELNLKIEEIFQILVFATICLISSHSKDNFGDAGPGVSIAFAAFTLLLGFILLYDDIDKSFRPKVRRNIVRVALASGANFFTEGICGASAFPVMAFVLTMIPVMVFVVNNAQGMVKAVWRRASCAMGLTAEHGRERKRFYRHLFSDLAVATAVSGNAFFRGSIENLEIIHGVTYMFGVMLFLELTAA